MEALSDIGTASDIRSSFMKLMVVQLQNQNPLEPLDNNEMASQLAQLSQLQQLETLNSNFAQVLVSVERTYANSLIGKEISFLAETDTGCIGTESGTVEQVYYAADGEVLLKVGDYILTLKSVLSVEA
jgi:flagellar basal-body rod modification protein FlgD